MSDYYLAEAKEKWGHTPAFRESARRIKNYSKEDIAKANLEMEEATSQLLKAFQNNLSANSPQSIAAAEAHRLSISNWWYECDYQMHKNLADMYLADSRFTKNYEDRATGFAQYVHDAIYHNASSHE